MRIAITQSNYIPWKGYFDLIQSVDEFVLFDDAQYTRRDWRNRNRIKTTHGLAWLTIPVQTTGQYFAQIKNIEVTDAAWAKKHWKTIAAVYAQAPHFGAFAAHFERLYLGSTETRLSHINRTWLEAACDLLGIRTRLTWSMDYAMAEGRTERLVSICQQAGAGTYISGPSARGYIDSACFEAAGIELQYFDYAGYPEYPQFHGPFEHAVSVIDLLCHTGPDARHYMRRA
ncbi:MAG TPA: WbqC family protein [Vicinamibacterales bacterium]|nr:WbqC family protein [Vicinamibacterales bacterium]